MKKLVLFSIIILLFLDMEAQKKVRLPVDAVGFATNAWQMDSVIDRISRTCGASIDSVNKLNRIDGNTGFRIAICPHDDYTYAGSLYQSLIPHIRARTIIIFGVAHKAKKFGVEQKIVFDSFNEWKEPYGNMKVSPFRSEIIKNLPTNDYIVHDSLQQAEHSIEAIVPFLQHYNRKIQIIPILIPAMDFDMMQKYSSELAKSINSVMKRNKLKWGTDLAMVISNDAVHYGDEDWGGKNYATYGCDKKGYENAVAHENEIIRNSLLPSIETKNIYNFFKSTVQPYNWHEYQWPWCGRYCIPFGLLTGMYLSQITGDENLAGIKMGYETSISRNPLYVEDLKMGKTAVANLHHWVGYAAIGYK